MRHLVRRLLVIAIAATALFASPVPIATTNAAAPTDDLTIAAIEPRPDEIVGVAEPLTVTFARPVADRSAAERMLHVTSTVNPTGRYLWLAGDQVAWLPDQRWPAHSDIQLFAGGMPLDLRTGAEVLGVASISNHTFTVSIDGQVARQMPASMGKPTRPTPVGNFSVLEKNRSVVMDSRTIGIPLNSSEGYLLTAQYAERLTWGGVYVHSAPWSVSQQGNENVSHGCINLSPDNAAWYYNTVSVGDPVTVNP